MAMTRAQQEADTIYYVRDADEAFYTPDGEGRIWYESLDEALDEHDARVIHLDEYPEDY